MKLYSYAQLQNALVDSDIQGVELRKTLDTIKELEPIAVIRDCKDCMGATFGDCAECEKFKINEVQK